MKVTEAGDSADNIDLGVRWDGRAVRVPPEDIEPVNVHARLLEKRVIQPNDMAK